MPLNLGQDLGVLGNIKLTDSKLVAGAFRTIDSGSDTGSITVQRVEDGQILYVQSEDRLIKVIEANGWGYQLDNQLPLPLEDGQELFIPKMMYHRVIKGTGPLVVEVRMHEGSM